MFTLLNLLYLGVVAVSQITLYSDADYMYPQDRDAVVSVSMHREWWRDDGNDKYKFTGLMVPYVRDWEIVDRDGDGNVRSVIPPEPNRTAGMAFIFNKKTCNGKEPEAILRVYATQFNWNNSIKGGHLYKHSLMATSVTQESEKPAWFNQVIQRIERVAATDSAGAKEFLAFNAAAAEAANANAAKDASAPAAVPPAASAPAAQAVL